MKWKSAKKNGDDVLPTNERLLVSYATGRAITTQQNSTVAGFNYY